MDVRAQIVLIAAAHEMTTSGIDYRTMFATTSYAMRWKAKAVCAS